MLYSLLAYEIGLCSVCTYSEDCIYIKMIKVTYTFSRLIKCYETPSLSIKTGYDIISIVIREIIENQSNKYWQIRIDF